MKKEKRPLRTLTTSYALGEIPKKDTEDKDMKNKRRACQKRKLIRYK